MPNHPLPRCAFHALSTLVLGLFLGADFAHGAPGEVLGFQKINQIEGGLTATLNDQGWFGSAAVAIGDLDGDSVVDLAVGAYIDSDGGPSRGSIYILFMNTDGTVKAHQKISSTQGNFTGILGDLNRFGVSVAPLGDFDGDGVLDIAVGHYHDDVGGSNRGSIWLLFLNTDGTVKAHQKISDLDGGFTGTINDEDRFGYAFAPLGDLDGDGTLDLAVSMPNDDYGDPENRNFGSVWVLFLNPDGTVKSHQKISALEGGFTGVIDRGDLFGITMDVIGDLDLDGVVDIAVGAQHDDDGGADHGAVWILFLNSDGTVKAHQKISEIEGGFVGPLGILDLFSRNGVAGLGDVNGDSVQDLGVAAYLHDDSGPNFGAVWILFLNRDGTVKAQQKISASQGNFGGTLEAEDRFGSALCWLGDLDGDGFGDLAVGERNDDAGGPNRGAMWILFLEGVDPVDVPPFDDRSSFSLRVTGANPFPADRGTTFEYVIPDRARDVRLAIYDLSGRHLSTLVNERASMGVHTVRVEPRHLQSMASGVVFLRMESDGFLASERLVVLR